MPGEVRCARCGINEGLCLVTMLYTQGDPSGRVLVYCPQCIDKDVLISKIVTVEQLEADF